MKKGFGFRPSGGPSSAPVKVGEEIDVKIEAVGEKGDGIAKVKGFVLFVPGVKEGDSVKVRVTRILRKVGFAEVVGAPSQAAEAPAEETAQDTEDFGEDEGSEEEDQEGEDTQQEGEPKQEEY